MRIYVAGPLTGNYEIETYDNVNKAMGIAFELMQLGHDVFVPHLFQYLQDYNQANGLEFDYDTWLQHDLRWIDTCDAIFVIADSPGTMVEKHYAMKIGKRIFTDMGDVPVVSQNNLADGGAVHYYVKRQVV